MRIAVLTSSRADYSIYYPLLKELKRDDYFQLLIVVFGTHLSEKYGNTFEQIVNDGFTIDDKIDTIPSGNTPFDISFAIGNTIQKFSEYWEKNTYDLVLCLGDRYEMFAACAASIPYNIKLAHIHGGEKTMGAFDDCFRHSITHMSSIHFTSSQIYYERVVNLKESSYNVYNVGALSIDNIKNMEFLSLEEFHDRFNIDLTKKSILITFHPETVSFKKNVEFIETLVEVLNVVEGYQFIITMPNADTMGNVIREKLNLFIRKTAHAYGVESFGTKAYLTCMNYCTMMLGNTSSGFIEASYFQKPVINLGSRQNGRIVTPNIINCEIQKDKIIDAINKVPFLNKSNEIEIYGNGNTAKRIVSILKTL
jgi:GDP/UDP-N,N'-diacetylbacillosamine 2-epimerase (hydrolysing)